MISFKQFLAEGGNATSKYNTARANTSDISAALKFVSKTLNIPEKELENNLLGSTELTLLGKKKDSGDIDIALPLDKFDMADINKKMLSAVNGEGSLQSGTKVGSYAVPVNDKKVQVDLMFVKDKDWAKFAFYSGHGRGSKYPGAVRNILLISTVINTIEPNKDFILKDEDGNVIARASRSFKLDTGVERLFKIAPINAKTGKHNKSLEKVTPEELEAFLQKLGKNIKFSKDADIINSPDKVAALVFGQSVKAKDIMTAEDVIKHIKKLPNSKDIFAVAKKDLQKLSLPIPEEI